MKKILLLFFLGCNAFAQYPILTEALKTAGIYKTFEEFKNNKPSLPLGYPIVNEQKKMGSMVGWDGSAVYLYALDIPKETSRQIGEIFGFSDGKDIYVVYNEGSILPSNPHKFLFYKIEYLGKYPFMDIITLESTTDTNRSDSFMAGNEETISLGVLFFEKGEVKKLTKARLKDILSDNPKLLEEFKKEKKKDDYFKEYLINYQK